MLSERELLHTGVAIFHVFIHPLPLCPLLWPNITSGGWKNNSKTMVVQEENCAVKISDQSQPIRMNQQWTSSQEALRDESPKRTKDTKNIGAIYSAGLLVAEGHEKGLPIRLT